MNDGVSRPPNISSRFTGLGPQTSSGIDREKQGQVNKDAPHKDHASSQSQEQTTEEISLSLPAIRALIARELPSEAQIALAGFAELGDLDGAEFLCDRIAQKGLDHIQWPSTISLRQALELAAS